MTDKKFTQEDLDAAVKAERERCYGLALEAPFLAKGRPSAKTVAFDICSRIRKGEKPILAGTEGA